MAAKADEPVEIHIDEKGRVTASAAEVEQVDESWAIAIGRFIVAFANLEEWTRLFLRTFGLGAEKEVANDHRLWYRLSLMETVVSRLRLTGEMQARVDSAIRRFRDLTPHRNLLAHHPPAVHIYTENADGAGAMEVRHELHDSNDPEIQVTVEQLEHDVVEARDVEQELALLYGEVRQPKNRRR